MQTETAYAVLLSPNTGLINVFEPHGGCTRFIMSVAKTQSAAQAVSISSSSLLQTLGAAVLGSVILFAVGFAPMNVAHNAAHDTRHTLAFPCH